MKFTLLNGRILTNPPTRERRTETVREEEYDQGKTTTYDSKREREKFRGDGETNTDGLLTHLC